MRRLLVLVWAGSLGLVQAPVTDGQTITGPVGGLGWENGIIQGQYPFPTAGPLPPGAVSSPGHVPIPVYSPGFYGFNPRGLGNAGYAAFVHAANYSYGGYPGAPSSWYGPYDYGYSPGAGPGALPCVNW